MKYERGKCYKVLVGKKPKDKSFEYTGDYIVIECEESADLCLKGTVIGHSPEIGKVHDAIRIGSSIKHKNEKSAWLIAESRENVFF